MSDADVTIDQHGPPQLYDQPTVPPSESSAALAGILDQFMAELQAGKAPHRSALLAAHPELASQLEACLAGIEFVHHATGAGPASEEPAALGEFRIVREIGRGGMGVVYEAEQTSLRRRVALKVLRFGVVADQEAMQRFRREAETVARLHHTNIVPIFAIGCERGVHYYAMQFIEGRSLADVLENCQRTGKFLAAADVVRWGIQAAEALAHAHQRGVIHRDIKPSNLLLDGEGVVWLTDFGLAKRADEVTMTASGTLMGTPRYMSPEQAESLQRTIDHRTDLYSLGASLYELATGRPVFESATPHGVIIQILTEDPVRPKQMRADLPRDLETVILTCLAKEPAQRYQTAQGLADDLRAVLDGRSIQARRVPLVERVVRYVRKRKKGLRTAAIAVASTVLLMLSALAGWRFYSEWRLGRIILTTHGPPLTAQVLPEWGDEPISEPFDVGTRAIKALPAGEYRLRVKAMGLMSRIYRFAVHRAETRTHQVSLDEDRLLGTEPIPFSVVTEALKLTPPGKADFVEWTGQTLIRRDGTTGKPIWDASRPEKPWEPKHDPVAWIQRLSHYGNQQLPGKLVQPAPDLNGDGTGDLVWVIDGTPSFLAISGGNGSLLWTYSAKPDGPGGPDPAGPATPRAGDPLPVLSRLRGDPAVGDVDGDGIPDLIATFVIIEDPEGVVNRPDMNPDGRRGLSWLSWNTANRPVVVAVSGRSGRWLWNYPLARRSQYFGAYGTPTSDVGLTIVTTPKGLLVAVVDGSRCIRLDPATGRPRGGPIDLGFEPGRPVQYADLDGDREPEIIAVGATGNLVAISLATGQPLWSDSIRGYMRPWNDRMPSELPLVADLDGDGRAELVVPDQGPLPSRARYSGLRVLDGVSGQTRWTRPIAPDTNRPADVFQIVAGPDLDGDGTRDIVAVSAHSDQDIVYVDALSAKDGYPLWWWKRELGALSAEVAIWTPRWWDGGPNVGPLLAVPLGGPVLTGFVPQPIAIPPVVHLLAASTGRELATLDGLAWPKLADLDGDGIDDLWGSVEGKLRAIRGERPEAWRALGRFLPAGDLDGDGIADVVSADLEASSGAAKPQLGSRIAVARSGRDGRLLWERYLEAWEDERSYTLTTFPLPDGDLDGDSVPDVVISPGPLRPGQPPSVNRKDGRPATLPVRVLSGRSGRPLWSAGPLPLGFEAHGYSRIEGIDVRRDGETGYPALLVLHDSPSSDVDARLARLSGRDGRVLWDIQLGGWPNQGNRKAVGKSQRQFGDLDGDGKLDLVLAIPVPREGYSSDLHAVSLADGKVSWAHPFRFKSPSDSPHFAVGDLDGDGRAEVILRAVPPAGDPAGIEIVALEGRDGSTRWTWRGGSRYDQQAAVAPAPFFLVDSDGKGRQEVYLKASQEVRLEGGPMTAQRWDQLRREAPNATTVSYPPLKETWRLDQRVVILDAHGQERLGRVLPATFDAVACTDLDGDGRAEFLFQTSDRLLATRGNLQDLWCLLRHRKVEKQFRFPDGNGMSFSWNWPIFQQVREIIPGRSGQPAAVVLDTMLALDGATGRPLWSAGSSRELLDEGSAASLPRWLTGPEGTTACRVALTTSSDCAIQPARGELAKPSLAHDDPRWERPLPWAAVIPSNPQPQTYLSAAGLALINVVVPLIILWLARRRRVGGLRMLIALLIAVAIPPTVFLYRFGSFGPELEDPATWATMTHFVTNSLAGLPVLAYAVLACRALAKRRARRLAWLAVLTMLATLMIAAIWLWSDTRIPLGDAREHYTWSDWYLVIMIGAYVAGLLALTAWAAWGLFRFVVQAGRKFGRMGRTPVLIE
jgi:tRNA A-37 threonylcarbamoyl transferase component Bud32/outer membrane protein assembly factor BamB